MSNFDTPAHTQGALPFVDDLPAPPDVLFAAVVPAPVASGALTGIKTADAEATEDVVRVFTAKDIPGENQIGAIIQDEPLLAEDDVHCAGQPVAFVVAETPEAARAGAARVVLEVDEERPAVFDPREAAAQGDFIVAPRTLVLGDIDAAWQACETIVEGRVDSGGQEHVYLETQVSLAFPAERGRVKLMAATQSPTAVQRAVANVLGYAMNKVEVDVPRLGGAFGGKEDQATRWAVMAALAATTLQRPVKLSLHRDEDMRMTGKRHPYSSDFKIGIDRDLKIVAFEVSYYQNSGATADLSPAVMERTLLHATNTYFIPNVRITGMCCRTNLPPFTAFRGFGAPQAVFVMEAAIARAAAELGVPPRELQRRNLLSDGDLFPYGMRVGHCRAQRCFREAGEKYGLDRLTEEIDAFNARSKLKKRGLAVMPICFGISFSKTMFNQAGALVHVYTDGSVSVSTAAVEMGQGVNTKLRRIVARTFGIDEGLVRLESTNTTRVANMSPTAASTGTDLNGMAARMAAEAIAGRLRSVAGDLLGVPDKEVELRDAAARAAAAEANLQWATLIEEAYCRRVNLSAQALYATPRIHYDDQREKGEPFAYHVFGTAITTVTVDGLRGTYDIDSVQVVHDAGHSLDVLVDRGQAEGGIVQGIGWMTIEELLYDERGQLLTDTLATYKAPDLHFRPSRLEVAFLEDADNPHAVMQTKAIGEPPFVYGIGAYFALLDALRAFRPGKPAVFNAPLTHERVFAFLHDLETS